MKNKKQKADLPDELFTEKTDYHTLVNELGEAQLKASTADATGMITIGRSGYPRITTNRIEIDLLFYNPNLAMKISTIKWTLFFSQPNLFNPRLENIHPLFSNYKQFVDIYQTNNCSIYLVPKSKVVADAPVEIIPIMATLKIDRLPNASFGYGITPDSYIVEHSLPTQQMFI